MGLPSRGLHASSRSPARSPRHAAPPVPDKAGNSPSTPAARFRSAGARSTRKTAGRCPDYRSEEHTSELQSLMRISYAVFCLKKKTKHNEKKLLKTTKQETTYMN